MVANDPSREMRVRCCRSPSHPEELLERSPTLPRTRQTTAGNDGNCRRKATVNSNLGFEAKNTIGENILTGRLKPSAGSQIQKLDNQTLVHNTKAGTSCNVQNAALQLIKTASHNLRHPVASSRAIPASSYSNHHQLQATVANKSLVAGQPVATSKRRCFLLALQGC
ncbi:hypothetical protein F511_41096 [Dorcoceras hygrometricum]|uniref:Uncharacterized protein n=1 Tax=Dorcoceras hygrometricum TaxID=472368 RepID=A0A2Z7CJR2_9LAMI|nr:hypothetical protein F511_41096 [Dorcoceras hygrometricum]